MELYATGFNAWNQLAFSSPDLLGSPQEPDDLHSFTPILSASRIESVVSRLSYTLVGTESGVLVAGFPETEHPLDQKETTLALHRDYESAVTATGRRVALTENGIPISLVQLCKPNLLPKGAPSHVQVKQLAAYDAGIAALLVDGSVWVSGDPRYPNCMGNDTTDGTSSDVRRVTWLDDLPTGPVKKIAAGGYTLAALTEGGDLYCWGGRPGERAPITDLSGDPSPEDFRETDIADIGLGEQHAIVLTTSGDVLLRGNSKNGRLGLGADAHLPEDWLDTWTKVDVPLTDGYRVVGVAAGPRASFVLVARALQSQYRNS